MEASSPRTSRLAAHFNIPIRHYEKEEKLLPRVFLDYKSMVAHDFIVKNREKALKYKLIFGKNHPETITLPAPSLFDLSAGKYLVPLEAIHAYWSHHLILTVSLFISGIRRRSPTSGSLRILLSTPERAALIHGQ